jgi:hypothetical protein
VRIDLRVIAQILECRRTGAARHGIAAERSDEQKLALCDVAEHVSRPDSRLHRIEAARDCARGQAAAHDLAIGGDVRSHAMIVDVALEQSPKSARGLVDELVEMQLAYLDTILA